MKSKSKSPFHLTFEVFSRFGQNFFCCALRHAKSLQLPTHRQGLRVAHAVGRGVHGQRGKSMLCETETRSTKAATKV